MNKLIPLFVFAFAAASLTAQSLVGTSPHNKNAILEEFTGVRCPNCPDGHAVAKDILTKFPRQAFAVRLHPTNSSYTTPYKTSDPDFRRAFLDAFYSSSYLGSRFMPGAMVNRRSWSGERISSRGSWETQVQTILQESSPVNIGLASDYDGTTDMLTVDVELYFTEDVLRPLSVFVYLMEDGLVSEQSNGGSNYVHEHVFREALTAQWGDDVSGTTMKTDLVTMQVSMDMTQATDAVDMQNAEVMAFVYNKFTGEVITGTVVSASDGSTVSLEEEEIADSGFSLYPNPVEDQLLMEVSASAIHDAKVKITDLRGTTLLSSRELIGPGTQVLDYEVNRLLKGVYLFSLEIDGKAETTRFLKY